MTKVEKMYHEIDKVAKELGLHDQVIISLGDLNKVMDKTNYPLFNVMFYFKQVRGKI